MKIVVFLKNSKLVIHEYTSYRMLRNNVTEGRKVERKKERKKG